MKLRALQSTAQSTRTMYEAFVQRLRETQDQDVIQSADAQIPLARAGAQRSQLAKTNADPGCLDPRRFDARSLSPALLMERFSAPVPMRTRRAKTITPVPKPKTAAPPILANLEGAFDPRAGDAVIDCPTSAFARNTAALLQRLRRVKHLAGATVVTVTASEAGLAKTSVSVALARVAARSNLRVAVIDADLHRPSAARAMGVGPQRFGLLEVLTGTAPMKTAFLRDARSRAVVLSPAQPPRDPAAVLASPRMANMVAQLRQTCDLVIFSAPSLFAASETAALAKLSDAVLVVTSERAVETSAAAIARLRSLSAAPVGLVLAR
ncbi:MAG: P-loop NTPase [Rhizomicrobium sp.]